MIGDRVKWGQPDPEGAHAHRGGVVRAATLANSVWHVLVQRADGTFADELAANLVAVEPGASADVLERELAEVQAELIVERERITRLYGYITESGLEDAGAPPLDDPCGAAIDLLKTFQAELVEVGATRDRVVAELTAERDAAQAAANELALERDGVKAQRDAAIKRADDVEAAVSKARGRNRGPERIG